MSNLAPVDYSTLAAPVCGPIRRAQKLKRRLAVAGWLMLALAVAGAAWMLQGVMQP